MVKKKDNNKQIIKQTSVQEPKESTLIADLTELWLPDLRLLDLLAINVEFLLL